MCVSTRKVYLDYKYVQNIQEQGEDLNYENLYSNLNTILILNNYCKKNGIH